MHLLGVHRTFPKLKNIVRLSSQVLPLKQDEYTETPEYPPIIDRSREARQFRKRQTVYQKIQNLNTVEEKQIALNMPHYYGWRCTMLNEDHNPYNTLPLIKCYTRTHLILDEKLPDVYADTVPIADLVVKEIKSAIEDAIAIELEGIDRKFTTTLEKPEAVQREDAIARCIVRQINRIITNNLADKTSHIYAAQMDYDPRHEAFWIVGGTNPSLSVVNWRKQYIHLKKKRYQPVNMGVQYLGSPFLTLRSHFPLKPIIPYSEAENPEFKVEIFRRHPATVGYYYEHRHGANIPGFWPGDYDEFGVLSVHGRGHILNRPESFGAEDNVEALHSQALKASFGWLLAQANYQGFTTYNDLTYPIVTQTAITNGQLWSFYAYQLNTITLHNDQIDVNPKHNVCFGTNPLKLYESLEDGKVKGLNDDVLKILIQFYLNAPEERGHAMKPYLGQEEQLVADIEDDNKRCWLEDTFKHVLSNRPRHLLPPETYMWEKIYKIQHNTRFSERKVRPFEIGVDPFKRRLNEHLPPYIPKALRPYPRSRKKFETTYYPDV